MLGEFLLPPSNNLPRTCQEVFLIMKEIGMEYQAIDASPTHVLMIILYIMDSMHQKTNSHNVKLVDIELIK